MNILVLGIDQREGMTDPARTDTMLLFTLDRQTKTAGMLSINRDLWVKIPGGQREGKINTAHFLGEVERVPGGGPALAMQTVQAALDVPVQYYIRLNFSAFEQLIDLIGGIDLDIAETIDDPDYPDAGFGYEPFHIDAGWQHLDGHTALKYARTRATPGSDLDRARRQQEVILAVRDKLLKEKRLPQLLTQIGSLLALYNRSIQTNLTPGRAARIDRVRRRDRSGYDSCRYPGRAMDRRVLHTRRPGCPRAKAGGSAAHPCTVVWPATHAARAHGEFADPDRTNGSARHDGHLCTGVDLDGQLTSTPRSPTRRHVVLSGAALWRDR